MEIQSKKCIEVIIDHSVPSPVTNLSIRSRN